MTASVSAQGRWEPIALLDLVLACVMIPGTGPADRLTWVLEVAPVMIGATLVVVTGRRWPLTPLLYRLLFVPGSS